MEVILQSGRGTTGGSLDGHECAPLHLTAIFDKWDILHLLVSMVGIVIHVHNIPLSH